MDLVRALIVTGLSMATTSHAGVSTRPDPPIYCGTERWQSYIADASRRFELPEAWLHAVMGAESAGCERLEGVPTTSYAGAMGLMQLMPATWAEYRERLNLGNDPYSPRDNILAGAAYLRTLDERYGWPSAAAAYHLGPSRYDDLLASGQPLPQATMDYLAHIDRSLKRVAHDALPDNHRSRDERAVFVTRTASESSADLQTQRTAANGLFVALRRGYQHSEHKSSEQADEQDP